MNLLLSLSTLVGLALATPPSHGWDNALQGQFIDFGYSCPAADQGKCVGNTPFTMERAKAIANLYSIISLEKCSSRTNTEEAIWESAKLLKSFNPNLKVYFYLATDFGGLDCYAASDYWRSQTQWHLKADNGTVIMHGDIALVDYANEEATDYWANLPLNGTKYADLIDGVLADSSGDPAYPGWGISDERMAALTAGKKAMIQKLQAKFDNSPNGGSVLQNVLNFYGGPPYGEDWLQFSDGAMLEHFAAFEALSDRTTGKLNATLVAIELDAVSYAAAQGKMVVMGTWPGQYVAPMKWANDSQPTTVAGWRAALVQKHTFALAGYLTVATPTVYMQYMEWYNGFSGGAVPCPTNPSSCPAPDPWYPDLFKPLGLPLGPATRVGNVWTRHFEHATSSFNVDEPDASTVTFS